MSTGSIILYGIGSPIVVDVEESLFRLHLDVAAGVMNVPGHPWMLNESRVIDVEALRPQDFLRPFLVPLFAPGNRQAASKEACDRGFRDACAVVDPTSVVPRGFSLPAGGYVNAGCTIGAAGSFGEFVFVNRGVSIGHHAVLERFVSIGPGVVLGGQVKVGKGALVGAGSVVLPGISIGPNAIVGAGAVVTADVQEHTLVVGNPARMVKTGIAGYKDLAVV